MTELYCCLKKLPPIETPVLALVCGEWRVAELRTENPSWDESFKPFNYWDDPNDDGQVWDWYDVTYWTNLPSEDIALLLEQFRVEFDEIRNKPKEPLDDCKIYTRTLGKV